VGRQMHARPDWNEVNGTKTEGDICRQSTEKSQKIAAAYIEAPTCLILLYLKCVSPIPFSIWLCDLQATAART
jgi:hypothetical protein